MLDRAAYYLALEGVTRFSLVEAARAILRGALGHTFFPSPVEIRMQCDKVMAPYVSARRRMEELAKQQRENAAYEAARRSVTHEGKERCRKIYQAYNESYKAMKRKEPEGFRSSLDPELLKTIPDRPAPKLQEGA